MSGRFESPSTFEAELEAEWEGAARTGGAFALWRVGIDGAPRLDGVRRERLERAVGARLGRALRASDVLAPASGGGVVVLTRGLVASEARALAARARDEVAERPFDEGPLTVSIGVATTDDRPGSLSAMRALAQARLRQAQLAGGDRVAAAERASHGRTRLAVGGIALAAAGVLWLVARSPRGVDALVRATEGSASTSVVGAQATPASAAKVSVAGSAAAVGETGYTIASVELDRTRACLDGTLQYRVRASGPAMDRVTALTTLGNRQGRGMVGLAQFHGGNRVAGDHRLEVMLVDELTSAVLAQTSVPVSFEGCSEPPKDALILRCELSPSAPRADCVAPEASAPSALAWTIRAAYPDRDGEPQVVQGGTSIQLPLPRHEAGGPAQTYWITAKGKDQAGVERGGRTSVYRERPGWRMRVDLGQFLITTHPVGPDTFELVNESPEALTLDAQLRVEDVPCGGEPVSAGTLASKVVLGRESLAPFERVRVTFRAAFKPGVCGQRLVLGGKSTSGGVVVGQILVTPPAPQP